MQYLTEQQYNDLVTFTLVYPSLVILVIFMILSLLMLFDVLWESALLLPAHGPKNYPWRRSFTFLWECIKVFIVSRKVRIHQNNIERTQNVWARKPDFLHDLQPRLHRSKRSGPRRTGRGPRPRWFLPPPRWSVSKTIDLAPREGARSFLCLCGYILPWEQRWT